MLRKETQVKSGRVFSILTIITFCDKKKKYLGFPSINILLIMVFFLLCFLAVCEEARREIYGFLLLLLCERENTREKKLKNRLNWKNRKKITEKPESWKKPIKLIKILKKPTSSVRFYRSKTKKTELNQTEKNRFLF